MKEFAFWVTFTLIPDQSKRNLNNSRYSILICTNNEVIKITVDITMWRLTRCKFYVKTTDVVSAKSLCKLHRRICDTFGFNQNKTCDKINPIISIIYWCKIVLLYHSWMEILQDVWQMSHYFILLLLLFLCLFHPYWNDYYTHPQWLVLANKTWYCRCNNDANNEEITTCLLYTSRCV